MYVKINPRQTLLGLLPKNAMGAEIGVWKGDFSHKIMQTAKPKKLLLIDPWQLNDTEEYADAWYGAQAKVDMNSVFEQVTGRFIRLIDSGRIEIIRESSQTAVPALTDASLDFVYIDGDHTYEAVLNDLKNAFLKIVPGGFICGDDYSLGNWWGDGVVRAVNEFIGAYPVKIELFLDGQFMLKKQ